MNITDLLKQASKCRREAEQAFRQHPLWKAIEDELRKTPKTTIVDFPEGTTFLHWDYNGNGGACGSGVHLRELSLAHGGAWIKLDVTFKTEESDEVERSYSLGIPDDLLLNFAKGKFKEWLAERTKSTQDYALERAQGILKQAGIKKKLVTKSKTEHK